MMKYIVPAILLFLLSALSLSTTSCRKKNYNSNGNLEFSLDTLVFDTVFTTVGSTTGQFKIYNRDNKGLRIEEIELVGGESSPFSINVDGLQGTHFEDIDMESKDSLFCFVEVTLGVNGTTLPMIVEDSIRFRTNGQDQYVRLAVWGQDAYFHNYDLNSGTWPNDKPHVIYGKAQVAPGQTLNIPAGTDVYLHKNSALYVFEGTLNVNGTADDKVTFQGDRLESFYDDVPGQYYGIYLDSAVNCTINHAEIKNATTGIHVESKLGGSTTTTLKVTNTEIWNSASFGMLLYDEPVVEAENTLIHSSGIHALIVLQGADIKFTHCDLLGYGPGEGSFPAVGMRNYFVVGTNDPTVKNLTAEFNNCVIYGSTDEEQLVMDTYNPNGTATIQYNYRSCLLKIDESGDPMFTNCSFGGAPNFVSPGADDFKFNLPSALSGTANPAYATTPNTDLLGNPRGGSPDIGAYEMP